MLAARFLVAADERRRVRVEEQDAVIAAHALDRIQRIKQLLKIAACTHIGDERHTFIAFGCRQAYLGKARDERDGQVIHAIIPQVLKRGDRAALACARHTGNDQKIHVTFPPALWFCCDNAAERRC